MGVLLSSVVVQCVIVYFACFKIDGVSGNATNPFPLLTPPHSDISFILQAFIELQNQWCPTWRYKKIFILNYSPEPLSEDILTAILKLNEPPKIISTEGTGITYWTFENRRCAVVMVRGYEILRPQEPIYYGSRYFMFHAKLEKNVFMDDLNSGKGVILDKAYHILYNRTAIEIYHKNFFTNETIQLDPQNIRVPNDLMNLNGRRLRLAVPEGNQDVATFDAYLGQTIAQRRNASFELAPKIDTKTDYGVVNIGVPFQGTDKMIAIGSTFISILVPRSKPKSVIAVLIDPFDYYSWIALFALIFVLATVLSLFGKFLSKVSFLEIVVEMIMCILGGPSLKYGGWFENQIITNYCFLSIVIVSSYQSLIISYLSFIRYHPEIDSATDIRNNCIFPKNTVFANHLDLRVRWNNEYVEDMCYTFNSRENRHITNLLVESTRNIDKGAYEAYTRNYRVAEKTFYNFHLLYYFYNKSLIREMFPFFIHAFFESGLFDQYYRNKSTHVLEYKQEVFIMKAFSVEDLSIVWYLYISGVIVSFLWLLLEIVLYHCQRGLRYLWKWKKRHGGKIQRLFTRSIRVWK
uniref:Ionotropic glutamate receptor C-terminal domain-containing protein n=1 Tax=Anopheles minimus TaxID=112268 RepID=A0A182W9T9_9DIPT